MNRIVARWCLPLLITLLAFTAGATGVSGSAAQPDTLYLLPFDDIREQYNFTTNGSAIPETNVFPHLRDRTTSTWWWVTDENPENWTIPAGGEVSFHLRFDRLDQVVPVYGIPEDPGSVGSVQIRVGLIDRNREPFAWSTFYHEVEPQRDGPTTIHGRFVVESSHKLENDTDVFGMRVDVNGQTLADTPVELLVGGDDASRIQIEKFPYAAFRSWEETEARREACLEQILQRKACETRNGSGPEREVAPAGDALPALLLVCVTLHIARARFNSRARA